MALNNLADLFHDELRDALSAERQLVAALPKMAKKASNEQLAQAFKNHLAETEQQVERLEQAFSAIGKTARAKTCEAMKGLVEEASEMMEEKAEPEVMDAALIACAQKVEHYEIATYGTLCTWAKALGYQDALKLLKETLDEEEKTDKLLTQLSEKINAAAMV
jgi:ferritin-like metal-binding protein YciE